jgi:hypothetical protein
MKNTQRDFFTFNNDRGLQRDSVSKKWNGGLYTYLPRMNSLQNLFLVIFKTKNALCVYREKNTLNGEISTESVYYTSVNNNTNFKKVRFFLSTLYGIE